MIIVPLLFALAPLRSRRSRASFDQLGRRRDGIPDYRRPAGVAGRPARSETRRHPRGAVPLPQRLAGAGPSGVEIPLYRLDETGTYQRATLRIVFRDGEDHRLGTTGDFGFFVTAIKPDRWLRARS